MDFPSTLVFGLKLFDDVAAPAEPDETENDADDALDVIAVEVGGAVSSALGARLRMQMSN